MEELLARYPRIFDTSKYHLDWSIPSTWIPTVDTLCSSIQAICDENNFQITCIQMKEKYGALRFYTDYGNPQIDKLIFAAEKATTHICQKCGESSDSVHPTTSGWVQYLCNKCRPIGNIHIHDHLTDTLIPVSEIVEGITPTTNLYITDEK